jgi:hypothetical protein
LFVAENITPIFSQNNVAPKLVKKLPLGKRGINIETTYKDEASKIKL